MVGSWARGSFRLIFPPLGLHLSLESTNINQNCIPGTTNPLRTRPTIRSLPFVAHPPSGSSRTSTTPISTKETHSQILRRIPPCPRRELCTEWRTRGPAIDGFCLRLGSMGCRHFWFVPALDFSIFRWRAVVAAPPVDFQLTTHLRLTAFVHFPPPSTARSLPALNQRPSQCPPPRHSFNLQTTLPRIQVSVHMWNGCRNRPT